MFVERIEDVGLSQYSYVVGCEGAGEVAVVDPRRDVEVYEAFAAARGLRIAHVLETHIHADFASGAGELASRTGATLWLSAYDQGELYDSTLPHRELRHGDDVAIGGASIRALHTPGHTPEHLSFLVFDKARSATVPMLMLSGDFLFVGSLGRPDLLGDDAKRGLARQLFRSVREVLRDLPDGLEIAPGHGAGSMCGAGMSGRAVSTLGFERLTNPYLRTELDETAFVERILTNVPPFPDYYRRMKRLNAEGAPLLRGLPGQVPVAPGRFRQLAADGHLVIDLRDQLAFGGGHVPGAFGIGVGNSLSTWAAWVVPYDQPLLLIAARPEDAAAATRALIRVGLDDVKGYLDGGMDAWIRAGLPLAHTAQWSVSELAGRLAAPSPGPSSVRVVDVRGQGEWDAGHIAGAEHIMAADVSAHGDHLREGGGPVAVVCQSGYRSTVAASLLERGGVANVVNVIGGMNAWKHAGLPVEQGRARSPKPAVIVPKGP